MEPAFSEFTYGCGFTREFLEVFSTIGPPHLPNQNQEGELGYDLALAEPGAFFFVQFKLAHHMTGHRAKTWASLDLPHYRFGLTRARLSQQHEILMQLEHDFPDDEVVYAAPAFHEQYELNSHYETQGIIVNSRLVSPLEVGQIDDLEQHYVVFHGSDGPMEVCSEPRSISSRLTGSSLRDRGSQLVQGFSRRPLDRARVEEAYTKVTGIGREFGVSFGRLDEVAADRPSYALRDAARLIAGVEVLPFQTA